MRKYSFSIPLSRFRRELNTWMRFIDKNPNNMKRELFMKRNDRISLWATELSDRNIKQIKASEEPTEYDYLNELLEKCPPEKMKRDKEDDDWLK